MKKFILASVLSMISMYSFSASVETLPLAAFSPDIMKATESLAPAPVENSEFIVFANSIAGPKEVLRSDNCHAVVTYLRPLVGNKPRIVMDGGYIVQINKKQIVNSGDYSLFAWMEKCEKSAN